MFEWLVNGEAWLFNGNRKAALEDSFKKPIEVQWSFKVLDMQRQLVAFKDESIGKITSWK